MVVDPKYRTDADRPTSRVDTADLRGVTFPPLPETAVEGVGVAGIHAGARLLRGEEATERAIKAARAPRLLHVATHGFFLPSAAANTPSAATPDDARGLELAHDARRARVVHPLSFPLLMLPFAAASGLSPVVAVGVVLGATFGYYLPAIWVANVTNKRKRRLLSAFPDALDLLVSCVEAGLGLDAAFRRVAVEMETAAPELAREFQLVTHEISAGVPRVEALRHLERRTGLDEIRSLVNMLAQAERFGTSIARGLRVHSRMTRQKRMSRAEEEAARVSPKLTVVMILFLLPVLGMVLVGPALINVYEVLSRR